MEGLKGLTISATVFLVRLMTQRTERVIITDAHKGELRNHLGGENGVLTQLVKEGFVEVLSKTHEEPIVVLLKYENILYGFDSVAISVRVVRAAKSHILPNPL